MCIVKWCYKTWLSNLQIIPLRKDNLPLTSVGGFLSTGEAKPSQPRCVTCDLHRIIPNHSHQRRIIPNHSHQRRIILNNSHKRRIILNNSNRKRIILNNPHQKRIIVYNSHQKRVIFSKNCTAPSGLSQADTCCTYCGTPLSHFEKATHRAHAQLVHFLGLFHLVGQTVCQMAQLWSTWPWKGQKVVTPRKTLIDCNGLRNALPLQKFSECKNRTVSMKREMK